MALKYPAAASLRLARIAFLLLAVSPLLLLAAPKPAWWTTRGAVSPQQPADDYAAANLGQLKHMAAKARDELNAALLNQGGAGPAIEALIASFGVNLARLPGVAAAQSSTYNDPAANPSAAKAIDGNTAGNYALFSVARTSSEASPWWQADLGASRTIQSVEVWNQTGSVSPGLLANFYVFVSDLDMRGSNLSAPRSLASLLADNTVWKSAKVTAPPAPNLKIETGSRAGRYVMIRLEGLQQSLQLAEVKVLGVANTGAPAADDFAAATLGQLKAVAKPFYDRLYAAGYKTSYPWLGREAAADDLAIANLGQLKNLFSFDLRPLDSTRDTNNNKVPDWWEHLYIGRLIAGSNAGSDPSQDNGSDADQDGDGVSDIQEYLAGSNPNSADTDGDGLSDAQEYALGTNPNSSDGDHDGLSDAEEIALGTNPNSEDTDGDGVKDKLDLYPTDKRRSRDIPVLRYAAIDISTPITKNDGIMMVAVNDYNRVGFLRKDDKNSMYTSFSVPAGSQGAGVERHELPFTYEPPIEERTYLDERLDKKVELLIIQKYVYDVRAVNSEGTFTGLMGLNAVAYRKPVEGDFPPPGENAVLGPIPGNPQYNILYGSYGGSGLLNWRHGLYPTMTFRTLYPFTYTMPDFRRYGHGITNAGICWGNDHEYDYNTFIGSTIFGAASGAENRPGFKFDAGLSEDASCAAGTQEGGIKACWIKSGFYSVFGSPDMETQVAAIDNDGEIFGYSPKFASSFAHREPLAYHAFWFSGGVIKDFYSVLPEVFQQQVAFVSYYQAVEFPSYRGGPTQMNSAGDLLFTAAVADTQDGKPVWRRALLLWTRARNGNEAQLNEVELPEGFDLKQMNSRLAFAGLLERPVLKEDGTPKPDPSNPSQPLKTKRAALLFPVEFVEVTPLLKNEAGNDITNSNKPKFIPDVNEMVEEPRTAQIPNVAYRVLKVRVPKTMDGEAVRWRMTPQFTPEGEAQPRIRGQWPQTHPNRFEADNGGNYYMYERLSQAEARTTIDNNGETAVRINFPPIGFNKARVKMEFESYPGAFVEIDFEVPAIVVIDPGHGGTTNQPGSDANHAVSPSGALEKNMTLAYGLAVRNSLRTKANQDGLKIKIFMTRTIDENPAGATRAAKARDKGADVILIIHFNSSDSHTARGTLEVRRESGNVNQAEDVQFINRVVDRVVPAIATYDAGARKRDYVVVNTAVASDINLGNTAAYHPIRAGYIEVEFIDNPAIDTLLNTGPNSAAVKQVIVDAMREGIIDDLKRQPAAQ